MSTEEESKPQFASQPLAPPVEDKPKITLHINHEGQTLTFRVSKTTLFSKVFALTEKRFNREPNTFRFSFDGDRIQGDQRPIDLDMDEEAMIDAHLPQEGGH